MAELTADQLSHLQALHRKSTTENPTNLTRSSSTESDAISEKQEEQIKKRFIVQAAGHRDSIQYSEDQANAIMKEYDDNEHKMLKLLNRDPFIKPHIPDIMGTKIMPSKSSDDGDKNKDGLMKTTEYLLMENLTHEFTNFIILDVKLGYQTFDDDDKGVKTKHREDLYKKLEKVMKAKVTENQKKGIHKTQDELLAEILYEDELKSKTLTKCRYLGIRDAESTTALCGYRFEGISNNFNEVDKINCLSKVPTEEAAIAMLHNFFKFADQAIVLEFIQRLKNLRTDLEKSKLFENLKFIGNSCLFIYENQMMKASGSKTAAPSRSRPGSTQKRKFKSNLEPLISEDLAVNSMQRSSNPLDQVLGNLQLTEAINNHRSKNTNLTSECRLGMIDFAKVKYNDPDSKDFTKGKYEERQTKWLTGLDNLISAFEKYLVEKYG